MQTLMSTYPRIAGRKNRCAFSAVRGLLAITAVLLPAPSMSSPSEPDHERSKLGPGCTPERPAIAHHAGAVLVNTDQERTLIPRTTRTDWRTSEVGMVVTNAGSVLFQPGVGTPPTGQPLGVLRSVDRGASWDFIALPSGPNILPFVLPFDGNMGIDRRTGRAFSITPG